MKQALAWSTTAFRVMDEYPAILRKYLGLTPGDEATLEFIRQSFIDLHSVLSSTRLQSGAAKDKLCQPLVAECMEKEGKGKTCGPFAYVRRYGSKTTGKFLRSETVTVRDRKFYVTNICERLLAMREDPAFFVG